MIVRVLAAARYVELNPVRAGLVASAGEWRWSSARPHLQGPDDRLVQVAPLLAMAGDWNALRNRGLPEEELRDMRRHSRTGRPLGSTPFVERLERIVGRVLTPKKPGRKRKLPKRPKQALCPRNSEAAPAAAELCVPGHGAAPCEWCGIAPGTQPRYRARGHREHWPYLAPPHPDLVWLCSPS